MSAAPAGRSAGTQQVTTYGKPVEYTVLLDM